MSYFLVQHDLVSLKTLPNFIWNTAEHTALLDWVGLGDRWIAYAHIREERDDVEPEKCSLITGFYECIRKCRERRVPLSDEILVEIGLSKEQRAWMVEGKEYGVQPAEPVSVPRSVGHPIVSLLGHNIFQSAAVVRLKRDDFETIRQFAFGGKLIEAAK